LETDNPRTEELLAYRPAVRLLYYHETPEHSLHILMGKHKRNGLYTLPGGRLSRGDLADYPTVGDALWHGTMFREVLEEVGEDDMGIIAAMLAGDFMHIGTVLWRHPQTGHPCVEFLAAIRCDKKFSYKAPADSELTDLQWFDWLAGKSTPYINVELAVELLYDVLSGYLPEGEGNLNHDEQQFSLDELKSCAATLNALIKG
jgi:8-oxo-dGTP pyrophosphatase MutT (NUDIX family)